MEDETEMGDVYVSPEVLAAMMGQTVEMGKDLSGDPAEED